MLVEQAASVSLGERIGYGLVTMLVLGDLCVTLAPEAAGIHVKARVVRWCVARSVRSS